MDAAQPVDNPPPPTRRAGTTNLTVLQDVEVRLSVEVGATTLRIRDLLALSEGSVVELDRYASEMLDVLVNGTPARQGRGGDGGGPAGCARHRDRFARRPAARAVTRAG